MKYDTDKKEIILDKELNELDKYVLEFIKILEKHVDYVIISGYVSILLGRSRSTEDIDLFIAATAISNNLTVVTNNKKYFRRIPKLKLY